MNNFSEDKIYIERDLERKLLKYIDKKEIIAIIGTRQCGKTTLMNHIFRTLKNAEFITFEDREIVELFSNDIKSFVELYVKKNKYLFIDEFQYALRGGKQLKYIYDTQDTKIIISGSSAPELTMQSIKYLAGRIFSFNLYPLSFEEYLNYKNKKLFKLYLNNQISKSVIARINKYYNEYIVFGGYPRVAVSETNEEKQEVLKNIYNTYFLREIREILQLQNDFKLIKFIKLLALQTGSQVNYNELSSQSGFSRIELLKNLNILEKTFICIKIKPFFTNKKKEIVKAPKIFFLDNGFRNIIIKNLNKTNNRTDSGILNENFVVSELIKQGIESKYWRTKAGAEVDFIIERKGNILPIEVKSHLKNSKTTKSFNNFLEMYKPKKAFILSDAHIVARKIKYTNIEFKPLFVVGKLVSQLF